MASGAVEQQVYAALTGEGLTAAQAAGVMGNMVNESSLNVETDAMDSNGQYAYGLISWNAGSYPDASSLVTGNRKKDLADQVNYLLHNTSGIQQGLQGGTAAAVASNFAAYVENCAGCQQGGAQNAARQQVAAQIYSQAKSGNWKAGVPVAGNSTATLDSWYNPVSWVSNLWKALSGGVASGENSADGAVGGWVKTLFTDYAVRGGLILIGVIILVIGLVEITRSAGESAENMLPGASKIAGAA